jgi:cytochrome c peroxidase
VTFANVAKALAAFERGLVTRSRWDAFLAGDRQALTPGEIRGLRVFLQLGCVGCHTGPQVGASMFRVAGFVEPWPNQRDQGRFEVTGAGRDHMVFKVPTMKNVARTAPYFHDGSCQTLPQAIRLMGKHQLGLELSEDQVSSIASFLMALSGEAQQDYIARPVLPGLAVAEAGGGP